MFLNQFVRGLFALNGNKFLHVLLIRKRKSRVEFFFTLLWDRRIY